MPLELNLIYWFNFFISLKNTKISGILASNKNHKSQTLINAF